MPMPLWWGQINKKLVNPRALDKGKWAILTHVGRSSGKVYRTPLDACEVDGTLVFILVYGSRSDWVQNILASGEATLQKDGELFELNSPRLISSDVTWPLLDGRVKLPPSFLKIEESLQMDVVSRDRLQATRR